MFLANGLTLVLGPRGDSSAALWPRLARHGLGRGDVVAAHNDNPNAAVSAVSTKLRASYPAVVDLTGVSEQVALAAQLTALAQRFGAPATCVRTDGHLHAAAARRLGCDRVVAADEVRGVLWGNGLAHVRDVDIVGDVHGQLDALEELVEALGYHGHLGDADFGHHDGRLLVFVGDLVDKGHDNLAVLDAVRRATWLGQALCVRGNHEQKLAKTLSTLAVEATDGADWRELLEREAAGARWGRRTTLEELARDTRGAAEGYATVRSFLASLPCHLVLDGGNLVVVHAAASGDQVRWVTLTDQERRDATPLSGRQRRALEAWALYGPSTGRTGADGFPERIDWVPDYDGHATVVRGHVVHEEATCRNRVVSVDTGAGEGKQLSAVRWPDATFTSVDVAGPSTVDRHETTVAVA